MWEYYMQLHRKQILKSKGNGRFPDFNLPILNWEVKVWVGQLSQKRATILKRSPGQYGFIQSLIIVADLFKLFQTIEKNGKFLHLFHKEAQP